MSKPLRSYSRQLIRDELVKHGGFVPPNVIADVMGFKWFRRIRARFTDPALFHFIDQMSGESGIAVKTVIDWIDDQQLEGHL